MSEAEGLEEQSDQIVSQLDRLALLGDDALIAIGEFLLSPDARRGQQPGLRRALLEILLNLDLPEVEDIALQLLGSNPALFEIWQIGHYLEQNHPGKYTDSIRGVAEQALIAADVAGDVPGELFQLLGEVGNEGTVELLAQMPRHQEAYASSALALISDGSGLSLLEWDTRSLNSGHPTTQGRLAVELLAQQAYQNLQALNVLIELSQNGSIPSDMWPHILSLSAGRKQITLVPPDGGLLSSWRIIYSPEGNQTLYIADRSGETESLETIEQRLEALWQLQQVAPKTLIPQFISAQDQLVRLKRDLSVLDFEAPWGKGRQVVLREQSLPKIGSINA